MKPLGPIPAGFAAIDGELEIGGRKAAELVAEAGATPAFVYSGELLRRRAAELRAAMPKRLGLHYAVKANPFPPLLKVMSELVDGFDIASGGELEIVRKVGIDPALISFAGPGKRTEELEAALLAGATINLESEGEAARALDAGQRLGITPRLAVRVNPDFDLKGSGMKMGEGPSNSGSMPNACPPWRGGLSKRAPIGAAFTSMPEARPSMPQQLSKRRRRP